jgi:hypothetical protein
MIIFAPTVRSNERQTSFSRANVPLDRLGRHLCNHHRTMINTGCLTELWRVIAFKLSDDLGPSHTGIAIDQQTGHPVARRIG